MYRFVAIVDDPEKGDGDNIRRDLERYFAGSGTTWLTAHKGGHLSLWHTGERAGTMEALSLANGGGVVLGQLFRKAASGMSAPARDFPDAESARCVASRGAHLIAEYWGRYVAFLSDAASGTTHIVRDPGAAMPCYRMRIGSAWIFFSDLAAIAGWSAVKLSVNYDFLSVNVLLPQFQKMITGIHGVSEVLPGQVVSLDGDGQREAFLWDPYAIARANPIYDADEAATQMREAIVDAVGALSGGYRHVLTSVGGLDSSIILSCLAATNDVASVSAINLVTPTPKGDESRYGRAAAAHAGVRYIERMMDPRRVDLRRMAQVDPQPNPMMMFDCTAPAGEMYELSEDIGADALFYGVGGDNIFFQIPYILSALDYAAEGKGRSSLRRVVMEAARYGRRSVLFTLGAMLRERMRPELPFDYIYNLVSLSNQASFINPELLADGPKLEVLHPMLLPRPDAAKGKSAHVLSSALLAIPYYDHWQPDYAIERICPLLSQPVVELCLRIPTWNLVYGGVDRGLARKAFQDMLPPEVLHRTSKSTPDDLYEGVYALNLDFIREMLLDGELVRRKILVRPALEALLKGMPPRSVGPGIALEFLSWEMWAQRVEGYR
ncbi:asparagine synthase-related protein [Sphingopyxis fribergensis]